MFGSWGQALCGRTIPWTCTTCYFLLRLPRWVNFTVENNLRIDKKTKIQLNQGFTEGPKPKKKGGEEKWSSWMRSEVDLLPIKKRGERKVGSLFHSSWMWSASCSFNRSRPFHCSSSLLDQRDWVFNVPFARTPSYYCHYHFNFETVEKWSAQLLLSKPVSDERIKARERERENPLKFFLPSLFST